LIKCKTADHLGNAAFKYTAENFNPLMAMAADLVILETEELVENGAIEPDSVDLPGVFVDKIVLCKDVVI